MAELINDSWISKSDVCRCCLAAVGTWDLFLPYDTGHEIKETFSNMIQECYGFSMTTVVGSSRSVCASCVQDLRSACDFKKRISRAEERFLQFYTDITIKEETEDDSGVVDNDDLVEDLDMVMLNRLENLKSNKNKKVGNKNISSRMTPLRSNDEYDSDVPISEWPKNSKVRGVEKSPNEDFDDSYKADVSKEDISMENEKSLFMEETENAPRIKQISERKRVMLTCDIVLNGTTACPFRHRKSWFQCFFCQSDFIEMNSLRAHLQEIHQDIAEELRKLKRYPRSLQIDITDLKCRYCLVDLEDIGSLRLHFSTVHDRIIYNECIADYKVNCSPYSCHICMQEFHVFRTLTTHLNEHYANCICDVCGRSFINSKRLKVHKRTHENGQFPCSECGKVLNTKTSKANHMESVHSKRIIKCQICFEPMKHYNDRIKHMSEVHNMTHKFKCNICSKEYNIKHYLATHMRQTHGNKNKKCIECGMAFITNHSLKKHMTKHTGIKPHECSICGKSYARSYTLKEHMKVHYVI